VINVQNRVFVDIKIDGGDVPTSANFFSGLLLVENAATLFPTAEFYLGDSSGFLSREKALTEANSIVVTVGKSPKDVRTVTRQYRLFKPVSKDQANNPSIKAICIYDAPKFISESTHKSYRGLSSEVLRQIANDCRLGYSGPEEFNGKTPKDRQLWMSVSKNLASFVKDVAKHGFIDNHSAMAVALTSLGELRYRNVMDVIETPIDSIKHSFLHNVPTSSFDKDRIYYQVRQVRDRSNAGLMNNWQNYGSTLIVPSLTGVNKRLEKVDVLTTAGFLPINDQVSKTIGRAKVDYGLLDCGNTHANYSQALYQNLRQLGLFSESLSILTYDVTDVQLFDVVIYRQADAVMSLPAKNSDIYLVVGKSVYVKAGISYAERIELARMSLTIEGESTLKTSISVQNPTSSIAAVIADVVLDSSNAARNLAATSLSVLKALQSTVLNPAEVIFNSVRTAFPLLDHTIRPGIAYWRTLSSVLQGPSAGETDAAYASRLTAALASVTGHLTSIDPTVSYVATTIAQGANAYQQVNTALNSSNLNQLTKGAFIFRDGGIYQAYFDVVGAAKRMLLVGSISKTAAYAMSSTYLTALQSGHPTLASAVSDFNTAHQAMLTSVNTVTTSTVAMWNQTLRVTRGVEPPSPIPVMYDLVTPNNNSTYLLDLLDRFYESPVDDDLGRPMPDRAYLQIVSDEMQTNHDSQFLKWIPEMPLQIAQYPTEDLPSKVDQLESEINLETRRNG
jgi:hypothetical protein